MGTMSASDAAPLPRLGEVFFDVRGSSRSMRLSWYADTGVSVFSIWQGGTCTGTFRLPMEELPRLIDALHRGIQAPDPRGSGAYASQLPGAPTDPRLTALPGGYGGRDTDFTGPVTGDFRALRPGDQAGTMAFSPASSQIPQGSQIPRALPPAPLALPPAPAPQQQAPQSAQDYPEGDAGQYYPEQYYPEQAHYPEQRPARRLPAATEGYGDTARSYGSQLPEQGQYADPGYAQQGYQDRGYVDQQQGYGNGGYAEPRYGYADQGYADQGYNAQGYGEQGYGEQRYADQRYADQGYGDQGYSGQSFVGQAGAYSGQQYDGRSYQGPGYAAGSYSGQGYDSSGQGYDSGSYNDRGYAGRDAGLQRRGDHLLPLRPGDTGGRQRRPLDGVHAIVRFRIPEPALRRASRNRSGEHHAELDPLAGGKRRLQLQLLPEPKSLGRLLLRSRGSE